MSTLPCLDPERLAAVARSWLGTPFHANSCERGPRGGVCCHLLITAIYRECGHDLGEVPLGHAGHARFNRDSIMEPWLDASSKFARITTLPDVGDLLGFKIQGTIHHLAIMLPSSQIVHAVTGLGVLISPAADPTWLKRHAATWRPVLRGGIVSGVGEVVVPLLGTDSVIPTSDFPAPQFPQTA